MPTFCIVHSGLNADFEHYHSLVIQWFTESAVSRNPLRHHTIYRWLQYEKNTNKLI